MINKTRATNKEIATSMEGAKERKTCEVIRGWKDQNKTADKSEITTKRDTSKVICEKRWLKSCWDRVKQYKQNKTSQKNSTSK